MFKNYGSDPNVTKYLRWKTHETVENSKETVKLFMSEYENNGFHWAIIEKETNNLIGDISVNSIDKRNNNCEIGYQLGSKFWNRGYMTEALKTSINYLFNECKFHLIEGKHMSFNPASGRVLEKAGMTKDGVLKERRYNKFTNSYDDLICYSIINPND